MKNRIVCISIAKNEESVLPRFVSSVQRFCDKLIIVDTGSSDNTVEVAKGLGSEVHSIKWNYNFSEARNKAAKYGEGYEWIAMFDCDEILKNPENMRKSLLDLNDDFGLAAVKWCNSDGSTFYKNPIWRPGKAIWRFRAHNYLVQSCETKIAKLKGEVHHLGKAGERAFEEEGWGERYLEMMERDVKENPQESSRWFYLGRQYVKLEDDRAIECLEKCADISPLQVESAFALTLCGNFCLRKGDKNKAIEYFKRATDKTNKLRDPYLGLLELSGDKTIRYRAAAEAIRITKPGFFGVSPGYYTKEITKKLQDLIDERRNETEYTLIIVTKDREKAADNLVRLFRNQSRPPKDYIVWHNGHQTQRVEGVKNIRADCNFGSNCKWLAAMLSDTPLCMVMDDDAYVSCFFAQKMLLAHERHPDAIISSAGQILSDKLKMYSSGSHVQESNEDYRVPYAKGGGLLFPRKLLDNMAWASVPSEVATEDDTIFNACCQMAGVECWVAGGLDHFDYGELLYIGSSNSEREDHWDRRDISCLYYMLRGWSPYADAEVNKQVPNKRTESLPRYATHLPVLKACIKVSDGLILELGCGEYSTRYIHHLSEGIRPILSLESSDEWYEAVKNYADGMHKIKKISGWDNLQGMLGEDFRCSVALIDQDPQVKRVDAIEFLRDKCQFMVIHDWNSPEIQDGIELRKKFRYKWVVNNHNIHTAVLSDINSVQSVKDYLWDRA